MASLLTLLSRPTVRSNRWPPTNSVVVAQQLEVELESLCSECVEHFVRGVPLSPTRLNVVPTLVTPPVVALLLGPRLGRHPPVSPSHVPVYLLLDVLRGILSIPHGLATTNSSNTPVDPNERNWAQPAPASYPLRTHYIRHYRTTERAPTIRNKLVKLNPKKGVGPGNTRPQ